MKKVLVAIFVLTMLFSFSGCNKKEEIVITIPAGSMEEFVYSETVFKAKKNSVIITAGAGYDDTTVIIKPVKIKEENAYEPTYLTHETPVELYIEKNGWFRIGISVKNIQSNHDSAVSVYLQNIEIVE